MIECDAKHHISFEQQKPCSENDLGDLLRTAPVLWMHDAYRMTQNLSNVEEALMDWKMQLIIIMGAFGTL